MTVSPDISHAPGCFGSALMYRPVSNECGTCMFREACAPISAERLARIRAKYDIRPRKVAQTAPIPALPPGTEAFVANPKKVEELMGRLERAGISITDKLAKGINPFAELKRPVFLNIACHLLLRLTSGLHRDTLRTAYEQKLGWSKATAAAHALQVFQLLVALDAATDTNGTLQLRRKA